MGLVGLEVCDDQAGTRERLRLTGTTARGQPVQRGAGSAGVAAVVAGQTGAPGCKHVTQRLGFAGPTAFMVAELRLVTAGV